MATSNTLDRYVQNKCKIDLTDIFGIGRIRKLIFEYQDLHNRLTSEVKRNKEIMYAQAQSVTELVEKIRSIEDENEYLKQYIKTSDVTKASLQKKKTNYELKFKELEEENNLLTSSLRNLKEKYSKLESDFDELSKIHETMMEKIKENNGTDFAIDDIM